MPAHRSVLQLALSCALSLHIPLHAQTSNDPKALLFLSAKQNGLFGDDIKPWHLKASYAFLDDSGQITDSGSIEELHVEQQKLTKIVITRSDSSLTLIQTENGNYREGELDRKFAVLMLLASSFTHPIPFSNKLPPFLDLKLQTRAMGGSDLRCFTLKGGNGPSSSFNDPAYCLQNALPVLRVGSFADDSHQFIRNHIGEFQGRYVPMDITAGEGEKPELAAHLELLKLITAVDPADFIPSSGAVLQKPPLSTLIMAEDMIDRNSPPYRVRPISQPQPKYPESARATNIHGDVKVRATIGTDGHIAALHVITGPPQLQNAALDAIWQWRFEPPWHQGAPAQVVTVFTIHF